MASLAESIIERFLSWEMLGRGALPTCEFPVSPEPPYQPFPGYRIKRESPVDDGRRPSLIESWVGTDGPQEEPDDEELSYDFRLAETFPQIEIQVHLPQGFVPDAQVFQSFLLSLSSCELPLSFEVFGTGDNIQIQFVAAKSDSELVQRQATSWFPEAFFSTRTDRLEKALSDNRTEVIAITECGLAKVFHFPIDCGRGDLLTGIIGALGDLDPGELALLQVLFEPVRHPWANGILETVICDGDPFFAEGEELARAARQKVSTPLYGVTVRFAVTARSSDRLNELMRNLIAPLNVASASGGNELEPFYDEEECDHLETSILTERSSRRFGMLLNLDELTQLVRFPATKHVPKLVQSEIRSRPAPPDTIHPFGLELGIVRHRGEEQSVRLSSDQRVRHTHLIGASGTGKSTLMLNLIRQDMENGEGLALLDPHGDLVDSVLKVVPEHRMKDVILLDPSDEEFPIGFNILSAHSELEKTLLASDLCSVFRRFSTSWGDQMTAVLSNAILAFLESSEGGTLADLRRFLVEKPFRKEFLKTVQDPEVVYFWEHDHTFLSGKPEGSVVTRLNSFLRPKPIRYMVSQKENKLDFASLMDEGKILLARIPQGLIGEENAHLLGSLLVSKIHQLVMGRQARSAESRRPFWLYIDEFHYFMTASMGAILSGARKYNLGLTLAHQDLRQLEGRDKDVASAVLSNAFTRIAFRLGDHDARTLEEGFRHYGKEDLQNLGTGQAVCRVGGAENDFCLDVPWHASEEGTNSEELMNSIRSHSRESYGRSRVAIEADLAAHRTASQSAPAEESKKDERKEPLVTEGEDGVEIPPARPTADEHLYLPGRGGQAHKALQNFVKQIGEGFGYRATIEKVILDGAGYIDVALEREGHRVAVEISVTTSAKHELKNAQKCLEAGYDLVILSAADAEHLAGIARAVKESSLSSVDRIQVSSVAEIGSALAPRSSAETGVIHKGFKVKSVFSTGDPGLADLKLASLRRRLGEILRKAGGSSEGPRAS